MPPTLTLAQLSEMYQVCTKTLKRLFKKRALQVDTSGLLYRNDLSLIIQHLRHPDDIQAVQRTKKAPNRSRPRSPLIKSLLWILFCCLAPVPAAFGQIIYAYGVTQNSTGFLFKIDLANCTYCPVAFMNDNNCKDLILLPNGNVVSVDGRFIRVFEPPNQNATFLLETLPQAGLGAILNPAGNVYIATQLGLGVFDPGTNQFTYIGNWPAALLPIFDIELWYEGGQLYGYFGLPQQVAQIDVSNPGNSVIVGAINNAGFILSATNIGGTVYMAEAKIIYSYDPATGDLTTLCDFSNTTLAIIGISDVPSGFPEFPCLCTTNAGSIASQALTNYCVNQPIVFTHNGNQSLDNNDVLRFILFSNPNDTLGSIIATSSTPNFTFAPPMQIGVTYYVAAVAGNNLNGNVDLSDPCLDFSNANAVVWRPLPTIALTATNTTVCGANGCTTITATITGTAPFSFTYEVQYNGAAIGNSVTVNSPSNISSFEVCLPPGVGLGQVQVVVCSLTDAWCTNP